MIFDDGLQDFSIDYDLKFVCFNSKTWVGNGRLIPAGPLRENISSISKYDAIFLNGNEEDVSGIKNTIRKYNKNILIFETKYSPVNVEKLNKKNKYLIFSGIGNSESFKKTLLKNEFDIIEEIVFPDHYRYTRDDICKIKKQASTFIKKALNKN